jgi:hypothetical protein
MAVRIKKRFGGEKDEKSPPYQRGGILQDCVGIPILVDPTAMAVNGLANGKGSATSFSMTSLISKKSP